MSHLHFKSLSRSTSSHASWEMEIDPECCKCESVSLEILKNLLLKSDFMIDMETAERTSIWHPTDSGIMRRKRRRGNKCASQWQISHFQWFHQLLSMPDTSYATLNTRPLFIRGVLTVITFSNCELLVFHSYNMEKELEPIGGKHIIGWTLNTSEKWLHLLDRKGNWSEFQKKTGENQWGVFCKAEPLC